MPGHMNIIILDDYQDAVRKLKCASLLEPLNAKVFTNTVKGIGQLSVRLRDADVLVLIRERTAFPRQLLEKLPKLKLISQTGKVGSHIDVEACTRLGIAVAVVESEPILQGHPLLRLENAVCTPHIGYVEQDSYEMYFGAAFQNVVNFVNQQPTNLLNPEALRVHR